MDPDLHSLVKDFLRFRNLEFSSNVMITGRNDKELNFTYLVRGNKDSGELGEIGIIVKDWSRSCGYNVILEAERLQENATISKVMVVANQFSGTARELAEKLGIITLTKGELISIREIYRNETSAFDP
ncbi:MAG: restriction endonuclease [Candidatus Hodarchaeales archaeon]